MRNSGFSYPARRSAKKRIFTILLIAAIVAAGFFLRKKTYSDPYSWSKTSPEKTTFENAEKYCESLSESGFDDWRLPELHEIRTLADKCAEEENQDLCYETDSCEWNNCENELCGKCAQYEESVDHGTFWTKTQFHGGKVFVFAISTEEAEKNISLKSGLHSAKCVRINQ